MTQRAVASPELEAAILKYESLENEILTAEEQLKELKAQRKTITEHDLIAIVDGEDEDNGVVLSDGRAFTFKREVHCGVTEQNKPAALEWLTEQKVDDALYKRHLILSFPKNSKQHVLRVRQFLRTVLPQYEVGIHVGDAKLSLVDAIREILTAANLTPTVKVEEEVELAGATLSAYVKKCLKAGVSLPECFGVYAPLRPVRVLPGMDDGGALEAQLHASLEPSTVEKE